MKTRFEQIEPRSGWKTETKFFVFALVALVAVAFATLSTYKLFYEFAATAAYFILFVFLIWTAAKFVFHIDVPREVDAESRLKSKSPVSWPKLIVTLLTLLAIASIAHGEEVPRHVKIMRSWIGTTERTNHNDGQFWRETLRMFGGKEGWSTCAATVSRALDEAGATSPRVRSLRARDFVVKESVPARKYIRGDDTVAIGDLVIYQRGHNAALGHVEVSDEDWKGLAGWTIGANVMGPSGKEGIWRKRRELLSVGNHRPIYVTKVRYD